MVICTTLPCMWYTLTPLITTIQKHAISLLYTLYIKPALMPSQSIKTQIWPSQGFSWSEDWNTGKGTYLHKAIFTLSVSHVILNAVIQLHMIQIRWDLFHTSSPNIPAIDEFIKQNPSSTQTAMFDNRFQELSCCLGIKELEML